MTTDRFALAQQAYDRDDLNGALELLIAEVTENPTNVAGHLLTGRCFLGAGRFAQAFQVFASLVMHPEIRGHAELPQAEVDALIVETLLEWAYEIEQTGFPLEDRQRFAQAAAFYSGRDFHGRHAAEVHALDAGIQEQKAVVEAIADALDAKPA